MTELRSGVEQQPQEQRHTPLKEQFMQRAQEVIDMIKRGATPLTERFTRQRQESMAVVLQDVDAAQQRLSRRDLLRALAAGAGGAAASKLGLEASKVGITVRQYEERNQEKAEAARPYEIHQNAHTTFIDKDGEWYATTVPIFIALNDIQFNGMTLDSPDNPIPGIGYDVVRMQSTPQEFWDAIRGLDVSGAVKVARDLIPQISDRIDITYIDRNMLQQTIDSISDGQLQLADDKNVVSYLEPGEEMHMVFHDMTFETLAAQPAAQEHGLERTEESVRAYLSGVHELTADPQVFDRIVRAIVDGQMVRFNNIGSEGRDIQNQRTERSAVGIPLMRTTGEQTPQ